ncbi:MAG: hypothetical protein JWN78_1766 [Bacteroidota bacterium]|nr:hypothetical protein [Bacteroidota bacterium]
MKRFFLLLTFVQVVAFAQNIKLTWSPEIDNKKRVYINDIIHTDNTGIYYTTIEKKGGMFGYYKPATFKSVDKISSNFAPVFSKEFTAFDKDFAVQDIYYAKNNFLIFLSRHEKKSDETKYYVANMDMNGSVGTAKEYFTANSATFAEAASNSFSYSYDSTKFLILSERGYVPYGGWGAYRHGNKAQKEDEKEIITVLNSDGTKAWQKAIVIENKEDRDIYISQQAVAPNGDAFFLLKEYKDDKRRETIRDESGKKVPGYKYRLLKVSNNGNTLKYYDINLGNLYLNSADIKINTQTNNLICSGFYNDQDNEVLKGLFYLEIDNTGNIIKKNNKDFPDDFIAEFKKHKETTKDRKNNPDKDDGLSKSFRVDKVYTRPDGGAFLLSEFYYSYRVCTTSSNGMTTCHVHYISNDILVVNIGADGKIDWFHRIPKRQHEVDFYNFSSYVSTVYNNKLYILFNDNPKNEDNEDDEKSANTVRFKKSVCMIHAIDKDEKVTKQELFKNDDIETVLRPTSSRVMNDNVIILYAEKFRDNDVKLGKIVIDK